MEGEKLVINLLSVKLGKHPPRNDPRTLQLAKYLDVAKLPPLPATCDWTKKVAMPCGMMANDRVGDCTCAGMGHGIQVWTASASKEVTVSDAAVLKAYSDITGYNPADPNTDQGANMLDVLNYCRNTGIGGHKIGAFVAVDTKNLDHVRAAIYLFGGLYSGIALPLSAQKQKVWKVPAGGAKGRGAPNSWGGHAVWTPAYTQSRLICLTWANERPMDWKFETTYFDEGYGILSMDWLTGGVKAPNGFNLAALQADLALIK